MAVLLCGRSTMLRKTIPFLAVTLAMSADAAAQPYSLREALDVAVQRSPVAAAAGAQHAAGQAAASVERAGLYPQLVASGAVRYVQPIAEINLPIMPEPIQLGTEWSWSTGLTAQWRVFDLSRWASVEAADHRADGGEEDLENTRADVERIVRDLYLSGAYMNDVIAATEVSKTALVRSLDDLSAQLEVGLAAEVDVAAARARVAEVEARLVDATAKRESALAALKVLLGLPADAEITLTQDVAALSKLTNPNASATHPKVAAMRLNVEASEADALAATRRWWPTLDVFATGEYRYPKTMVEKEAGFGWMAGAQLTWLLFDGGLRFAATDAQQAKARAMSYGVEALEEQLAMARADANSKIKSADANLAAAQTRLEATVALSELTRVSLEAGTARVTDMLDAEVQVDQARLAQVTAMYQLALAKSALWHAMGANFTSQESKR